MRRPDSPSRAVEAVRAEVKAEPGSCSSTGWCSRIQARHPQSGVHADCWHGSLPDAREARRVQRRVDEIHRLRTL